MLPAAAALCLLLAAPPAPRADAADFVWKVLPQPTGTAVKPRPRETARLAARGAAVYGRRCATCHGSVGRGDGPTARGLGVAPRDFTAAVYKIRSTPSGSLPTDFNLFQTISRGLHGTAMFPWVRLSEEDRWALVLHLKSLSPRFREEPRPRPVSLPPPPEASARLFARGQTLYRTLRCNACHGDSGQADGPAAATYKDELGRVVKIRHLDSERFVRGALLTDIFATLRTGMDGTPMGAYDGIAEDDLWALSLYVRDGVRRPPAPQPPARGANYGDPP